MGVERLIGLYETCGGELAESAPDVYIVAFGHKAFSLGLTTAEELRGRISGLKVELNLGGGSLKTQLKRADRSGATYAVILGEDEVDCQEASIKPLRTSEDQSSVALDELADVLAKQLKH
tara:strand:- start:130 stop:489 length:360 start_codon:yes stop_codon:yes gene_type:complete